MIGVSARHVSRAQGGSVIPERLLEMETKRPEVVSCYLRLEPEDRRSQAYLVAVKDAIDAIPLAGLDRETRQAVQEDLTRIFDYLRDPANLPRAPALALFASRRLDLFETLPLPRVSYTRLVVDSRPWLPELLAIDREFGRVLAVVLDRTRARFFEVTAFRAIEFLPEVRSFAMRGGKFHSDRRGAPGWGERRYHTRIQEDEHHHYDAIARELADLDHESRATGFVVAGPGKTAETLSRFLPRDLGRRVIGTARLNPKEVTNAAVYFATLAAREPHERLAERELAALVRERVGTRWAVNGVRATLRALLRGQVHTLLVRAEAPRSGFRCADSGRLVLSASECRDEGTPEPVSDLLCAAVQEAWRQGVSVARIRDAEAAQGLEDLSGLLRFR